GILLTTTLLAVLATTVAGDEQATGTREAALSMQQKITAIAVRGALQAGGAPLPLQRTSFTDREVNAYFEVYGPEVLPEGVVDPRITIEDGGRVGARAIVD